MRRLKAAFSNSEDAADVGYKVGPNGEIFCLSTWLTGVFIFYSPYFSPFSDFFEASTRKKKGRQSRHQQNFGLISAEILRSERFKRMCAVLTRTASAGCPLHFFSSLPSRPRCPDDASQERFSWFSDWIRLESKVKRNVNRM